jgi:hypothetical protein
LMVVVNMYVRGAHTGVVVKPPRISSLKDGS